MQRDDEGDRLSIVMEYIDGGTLEDQVQAYDKRNEHIPQVTVLQWFVQILEAIQFMHSKNILHRCVPSTGCNSRCVRALTPPHTHQ